MHMLSRVFFATLFVLFLHNVRAQQAQGPQTVVMNKIKLSFMLDSEGSPMYEVSFSDRPVIRPSHLGFKLDKDSLFFTHFQLLGVERSSADESWQPVWGEAGRIRDHHEQLIVHLQKQGSAAASRLDIIFRVFEDGIGFRYVFPRASKLDYFIVQREMTQFALAGDHKTFWIPGDYDTNEYPYTTSRISEIDNAALVEKSTDIAVRVAPDRYAVQTPLMMKSEDGLYINIHEAGLINYPAMQLHVDRATRVLTAA